MYQRKVNQTQQYSDSQGEHIVCEGKLVLLKNKKPPADVYVKGKYGKHPIIISETEEIEVGDYVLLQVNENKAIAKVIEVDNNGGIKSEDGLWRRKAIYFKILVFPQHFSDKHLQAIVDRKMEDSDSVYIACENRVSKPEGEYFVTLNLQNQITLFPVQQSLEDEAELRYPVNTHSNPNNSHYKASNKAFKEGAE